MSRHLILKPSLFVMLCLLLAWGAVPVRAATLTVSTTADSGAGSLREALTNAVAGDTITFTTSGTIQLLSNLPTISIITLTINGNGATVRGGTSIRIFMVAGGADVTINNLTMTEGNCNSGCSLLNGSGGMNGGGIYNVGTLTLTRSTLSGNKAQFGGGIYNEGTLTFTNSTVSDNKATIDGGGAIYNNGDVTLTNSTMSGNSADYGGVIYNGGTLVSTNSTFFNNSAGNGTFNSGGTIYNSGTATFTNSTLSGNSATTGGNIYNDNGTVTLQNALLGKGAAGANCDGAGTISSNGATYNLSNDASCGANVMQVASLGLGTLGANGGPTQTIPLLAGSPAIDAGDDTVCAASPVNGVDQRGEARSAGSHCDIGAFEYQAPVPAPTAIPAPALCSLTGFASSTQVAISLPNGGGGMNQCYSQLSDPAQVGVTQPFIAAVEVYSFDASGSIVTGIPVQVCLQGAGTLLYRDAAGQPRVTVSLPSFSQGGFICGTIPNAGTVILIPGAPAPAAIPFTALSACRVTTTNILNLRAEPNTSSAVLALVPYQTTLNASARSGGWLQVVVGNQQGWVSERYLRLGRTCK
jgi:hypothetical protein